MSRAEEIIISINEIAAKRKGRIRGRQYQTALVCPHFYKKVNTACIQDTPREARKISRLHKRIWRFKLRKKMRQLLLHRKASLARRRAIFGIPKESPPHTVSSPDEFLAVVKLSSRMRQILKGRTGGRGKGGKGLSVSVPTTTPISQGLTK